MVSLTDTMPTGMTGGKTLQQHEGALVQEYLNRGDYGDVQAGPSFFYATSSRIGSDLRVIPPLQRQYNGSVLPRLSGFHKHTAMLSNAIQTARDSMLLSAQPTLPYQNTSRSNAEDIMMAMNSSNTTLHFRTRDVGPLSPIPT